MNELRRRISEKCRLAIAVGYHWGNLCNLALGNVKSSKSPDLLQGRIFLRGGERLNNNFLRAVFGFLLVLLFMRKGEVLPSLDKTQMRPQRPRSWLAQLCRLRVKVHPILLRTDAWLCLGLEYMPLLMVIETLRLILR